MRILIHSFACILLFVLSYTNSFAQTSNETPNEPQNSNVLGTVGIVFGSFATIAIVSGGLAYGISKLGNAYIAKENDNSFGATWIGTSIGLVSGLILVGQVIDKEPKDKIPEYVGVGLAAAIGGGLLAYYLSTVIPQNKHLKNLRIGLSYSSQLRAPLYSLGYQYKY